MAVQSDIHTPPVTPDHLSSAGQTVLIIDDDDAIRTLSQWIIQRAGYPVLAARDGPEGLDCFKREADRIGLILLDLTMPRMTGAEVISALLALRANVPIVLITGYGEDAVREDEKIGVASVLQKPFTPDALRRVLEMHLKPVAPLK
ncbi:MAG TPA: response regulator [Opitutaceae bacterium]|nr:response regulator [Opitutaceae bacterium]